MAVAGLVGASGTANWPPLTTSPYSPSPRHVAVPAAGQAVTPSASTRGSNDHERPAFTAGPVIVSVPPTPRRWYVSIGAASADPAFWTSTRLVRPSPSVLRATSGR